jgi:putative sigma-54 modulation protein
MDVQAVDINISKTLHQRIREMIVRLRRHISEINWIDIYLKREIAYSTANRTLSVRVGIPGNDVFASDSGNNWMTLLKNVEEKLPPST